MKFLAMALLAVFSVSSFAAEDASIYDLQSVWLDQNNQKVQLKQYEGKPLIIGMIYSGCAHACPMTIKKVREIQKALLKEGIKDLNIVLASFDVKNDTPAHLKKYMKGHSLDEKQWHFISTPEESLARELSVVLGISYKDVGDGQFSHSNIITAYDSAGKFIAKVDHLGADIGPLVKSIKKKHSDNKSVSQ